jgi:hypothetical protein
MRRRIALLLVAVLLLLGVSACTRERIRREPPSPTKSALIVATPTQAVQEAVITQAAEGMTSASPLPDLPTVMPTLPATPTIGPAQTPSEAAKSADEREALLQDLEQLLRNTNTEANVP